MTKGGTDQEMRDVINEQPCLIKVFFQEFKRRITTPSEEEEFQRFKLNTGKFTP